MGVQGLADGFLAGFNTADAAISRNKELQQRDAALQQQVKDSDRNYSLREADFNYGKDRDQRNFGYQKERDQVGDKQWGLRHALDEQQVGISRAGTPPAAPATAKPQGQAPVQPPENSYAAGYLREMRQQSQRQQQ